MKNVHTPSTVVVPAGRICPRCGAPIGGFGPEGLCGACLFDSGMAADEPEAELDLLTTGTRRFGDYELIEEIARGGMGVICKARQLSLNRVVAVKMILRGEFAGVAELARFRAEAETAARLQHANIVAIHEVGEHEGLPYFSMDYVEGPNLAQLVGNMPLPAARAATYLKTVTEAVQYAHEQGVLHRDLKPSNVLIDANDQPRVTDFGLAKRLDNSELGTRNAELTQTGQVLGSPSFMPPEQAAGRNAAVGPASDVYSLGAMLYHALTGRPPFVAESVTATLRLVAETEPVSPRLLVPTVPRDLETICLKCLQKEPQRRYPTAQELADDLARFLRDEPIHAHPVAPADKAWRWCRRNRALASAGTAILFLLLAVAIGSPIAAFRINRERQRAEEARENETRLRQQAEVQELAAWRNAYASDMALVQQALAVNSLNLARELLDRYRPKPGETTKVDLRGWEWRYLWQFCKDDDAVRLCQLSSVGSISFSSDGKLLAVGGREGELTVWDTGSKQLAFRQEPSAGFARKVAFSPSRGLLAYNDQSGVVLWDSQTRTEVRRLETGGYVRELAFDKGGRLFTATTRRPDGIGLWDVDAGVALTNYLAAISEFGFGTAFSISADGRTFAHASKSHNVRVVTVAGGEEWTFPATEDSVTGLAFSGDGRVLATGSAFTEGTIKLWDLQTRQFVGSLEGHTAYITRLKFMPDGKTLASASADQTIRLWDLQTRQSPRFLRGNAAHTWDIDLSPDGLWLASGSGNGSVSLWDLASTNTRLPAYRTLPGGAVKSWAFSPDGRFIGAVQNASLKLYDAATLQPSVEPTLPLTNISDFAFSPDRRWIVATDTGGGLTAWDFEGQRVRTNFAAHSGGAQLFGDGFLAGGQRLLTVGQENIVKEWDLASWREVRHWQFSPANPQNHACAVSPAADLAVIAGGWVIEFITTSAPGKQRRITSQHYTSNLAFSPDRKALATSSGDGTLGLWDLTTEKQTALFRLSKDATGLNSAVFFADGQRIVAGGDGKQAIIICDLRSRQTVAILEGQGSHFHRVAISPDGQTIAGQNLYGVLHFWRAPSWAEIDAAPKTNAAIPVADPDSAWPLYNLASELRDRGKVTEAEAKYREALAAMKSAFGPGDQGVPVTLNTLANMLGNYGRLPEAEKLHREAAEFAQKLPPGKDQDALLEWSLGDIGKTLKQQGKPDEAEEFYRKALEISRKFCADNPFKTEVNVTALVDVFWLKGRYGDAEKLFSNVLAPELLKLPQSAGILLLRADFFARRGLWKEAISDTTKSLERDSINQRTWYKFAPLLVASGDLAGYHNHCQLMLARFGATDNPVIAEQTAKACLLLPESGATLATVANLAVTGQKQTNGWSELTMGLAEYRQGHFAAALGWAKQSLAKPAADREAQACMVMAMASHRLNQTKDARVSLAKGVELVDANLPKLDGGDLGVNWQDVLIAHILMREATALIDGDVTGGTGALKTKE